MSTETPDIHVGQVWRAPNGLDYRVTDTKDGRRYLLGVQTGSVWSSCGDPEYAREVIVREGFVLISEGPGIIAGCTGAPGVAVQILEIELRERLERAETQPMKRRVLNSLAALEGISEFLGETAKAEGGAK